MNPNCHIGRLGALAAAAALLMGLVGCDRGGESTTARTGMAASGAEATATAPGSTAASAVISGSGISSSTTSSTTTTTPGGMVGTNPPGAVAPPTKAASQ
jgi:hypothetical protein